MKGHDWSQLAQSYSFSVGVQREVGFSTVIDVAFVGNLGRHLLQSVNLNTLPYGERFLPSSQDPTTGKPLPGQLPFPLHWSGQHHIRRARRNVELLCAADPGEPAIFARARIQGQLDLVQIDGLRLRRQWRHSSIRQPSVAGLRRVVL